MCYTTEGAYLTICMRYLCMFLDQLLHLCVGGYEERKLFISLLISLFCYNSSLHLNKDKQNLVPTMF